MAAAENAVQRACLQLLAALRLCHWRNQSVPVPLKGGGYRKFSGRRGVADIIAVLPVKAYSSSGMLYSSKIGRVLAVECKSAKGTQSENQKQFQREVEAAGGVYCLARSVADLEAALRREGVLKAR